MDSAMIIHFVLEAIKHMRYDVEQEDAVNDRPQIY